MITAYVIKLSQIACDADKARKPVFHAECLKFINPGGWVSYDSEQILFPAVHKGESGALAVEDLGKSTLNLFDEAIHTFLGKDPVEQGKNRGVKLFICQLGFAVLCESETVWK